VIHVTAGRHDDRWLSCVRDNGIGIDPEYRERIFGLFTRLHRRDGFSGTGISLAICKRIVEQHGGNIWVESQLNVGSTFFLTLPEASTTRPKIVPVGICAAHGKLASNGKRTRTAHLL